MIIRLYKSMESPDRYRKSTKQKNLTVKVTITMDVDKKTGGCAMSN